MYIGAVPRPVATIYTSLEEPVVLRVRVLDDALREPESDLLVSALDGVGAVADVAANSQGKVTTDGTRGRGKGVGGTEHHTASLHGIKTLPDHSDNGT